MATILTIKEAAVLAGKSEKTIRRWLSDVNQDNAALGVTGLGGRECCSFSKKACKTQESASCKT